MVTPGIIDFQGMKMMQEQEQMDPLAVLFAPLLVPLVPLAALVEGTGTFSQKISTDSLQQQNIFG